MVLRDCQVSRNLWVEDYDLAARDRPQIDVEDARQIVLVGDRSDGCLVVSGFWKLAHDLSHEFKMAPEPVMRRLRLERSASPLIMQTMATHHVLVKSPLLYHSQ